MIRASNDLELTGPIDQVCKAELADLIHPHEAAADPHRLTVQFLKPLGDLGREVRAIIAGVAERVPPGLLQPGQLRLPHRHLLGDIGHA
jgi:hypothetical protein